VAVAFEASQRQVAFNGMAAMFDREDMIQLMSEGGVILMKQTILAPSVCALEDKPPKRAGMAIRR
jgi:hypothetical protein